MNAGQVKKANAETMGFTVEDNPKNFVHSVIKAFSVLKAFDTNLPELSISEVATRTQLDRGTAFRLVNTLVHLEYLTSVPRGKRFRLTLKCLELGYTPLARANLKDLARPMLQALVPEFADAASLGMLDGADVVYVERAQIDLPQVNVDRRVGSRTGAYAAALGHALLACLSVEKQRELLERSNRVRLSEKTLVDIDAILLRLAEVKRRGYALADGDNAYGLRTVAAAILDTDGLPIAAVSLTIHAERMPMDEFSSLAVPKVLHLAHELTRAIRLSFGSIVTSR